MIEDDDDGDDDDRRVVFLRQFCVVAGENIYQFRKSSKAILYFSI